MTTHDQIMIYELPRNPDQSRVVQNYPVLLNSIALLKLIAYLPDYLLKNLTFGKLTFEESYFLQSFASTRVSDSISRSVYFLPQSVLIVLKQFEDQCPLGFF